MATSVYQFGMGPVTMVSWVTSMTLEDGYSGYSREVKVICAVLIVATSSKLKVDVPTTETISEFVPRGCIFSNWIERQSQYVPRFETVHGDATCCSTKLSIPAEEGTNVKLAVVLQIPDLFLAS